MFIQLLLCALLEFGPQTVTTWLKKGMPLCSRRCVQASVQGVWPSAKNEAPHSHRSRSPTQHPAHAHTRWLMSFESIDVPLMSMGPSSDSSNGFLSLLLSRLSLKTMESTCLSISLQDLTGMHV